MRPIIFDGSISITQKSKGNSCILRFEKQEYSLLSCTSGHSALGYVS